MRQGSLTWIRLFEFYGFREVDALRGVHMHEIRTVLTSSRRDTRVTKASVDMTEPASMHSINNS